MLGYLSAEARGATDRLIAEAARTLAGKGWPLAGAVQINRGGGLTLHPTMELRLLGSGRLLSITQRLGPFARGCRLDSSGLEQAAGLIEADMDSGAPRLLILNKFGKQEAAGGGFRPLIGRALERGIPVLTGVGRGKLPEFLAFAEGMAEAVAPRLEAVLDWAARACAESAVS